MQQRMKGRDRGRFFLNVMIESRSDKKPDRYSGVSPKPRPAALEPCLVPHLRHLDELGVELKKEKRATMFLHA
jgi:hypothetical protein